MNKSSLVFGVILICMLLGADALKINSHNHDKHKLKMVHMRAIVSHKLGKMIHFEAGEPDAAFVAWMADHPSIQESI